EELEGDRGRARDQVALVERPEEEARDVVDAEAVEAGQDDEPGPPHQPAEGAGEENAPPDAREHLPAPRMSGTARGMVGRAGPWTKPPHAASKGDAGVS